MLSIARALLRPINPTLIVLLGVYTIVWGFWVANPFWEVFTHAQLYSALLAVFPEYVWGTIAIICGIVISYGAVKRSYSALTRGALFGGWFWFIVSIFYFVGDAANTGGITALIFAIYGGFVYVNLRVNFKEDQNSPLLLRQ